MGDLCDSIGLVFLYMEDFLMKKIILLFSAIVMTVLYSFASIAEGKEIKLYIEEESKEPFKTIYVKDGKVYGTEECEIEIKCPIPEGKDMPTGKKFIGYYDREDNLCIDRDFVAGKISDIKENKLYGHYESCVYEIKFMYDGKVIDKGYERYDEGFYKDEECIEVLDNVKTVNVEGYKFSGYKSGEEEITDEEGKIKVGLKYFSEDGEVEAESKANRYTFVWKKAVKKKKTKLLDQIKIILTQIDEEILQDQNAKPQEIDLSPEKLKEFANSFQTQLEEKRTNASEEKDPSSLEKGTALLNDLTGKIQKLETLDNQLAILGDRNSYSTTDKDASFVPISTI